MIRDITYWEGHIPTREEYDEIRRYCDDSDCYRCPYYWDDTSHCGHFDITELTSLYLKEAEEKIKTLEATIKDLEDCLRETEKDLQNIMEEKTITEDDWLKIESASEVSTVKDYSKAVEDWVKATTATIAEEDLPF